MTVFSNVDTLIHYLKDTTEINVKQIIIALIHIMDIMQGIGQLN